MIGFVAAISASLAVITLVVISSLIAYIESILPEKGLIKINDSKYRYVMDRQFVNSELISLVVIKVDEVLAESKERVVSYQTGCTYGFSKSKREVEEVSTYNHLVLSQYFLESVPVINSNSFQEDEVINTCYIDINIKT